MIIISPFMLFVIIMLILWALKLVDLSKLCDKIWTFLFWCIGIGIVLFILGVIIFFMYSYPTFGFFVLVCIGVCFYEYISKKVKVKAEQLEQQCKKGPTNEGIITKENKIPDNSSLLKGLFWLFGIVIFAAIIIHYI